MVYMLKVNLQPTFAGAGLITNRFYKRDLCFPVLWGISLLTNRMSLSCTTDSLIQEDLAHKQIKYEHSTHCEGCYLTVEHQYL